MWVLDKIRESVENLPGELRLSVEKGDNDLPGSAITSSSNKLLCNVITPDKIPEFCLPPRLCRKSHQLVASGTAASQPLQEWSSTLTLSPRETNVPRRDQKKQIPFSAEGYGLSGLYESPNTRRKESLFHAKCPSYMFVRSLPRVIPRKRLEREQPRPRTPFSGLLPRFYPRSLSETGSTESDTASSNDSSPPHSPYSSSPSLCISLDSEEDTQPEISKPQSRFTDSNKACPKEGRRRLRRGMPPITHSHSDPASPLDSPQDTLLPSHLYPLHCQGRIQQQHVFSLPCRGQVRLLAERTTSSSSLSLFTIRIRVVSVEGLRDEDELRPLNCALSLCLMPGKLQRQDSGTIRNCRSPVFNKDFFFLELSQDGLLDLQVRLKVLEKPGVGALKRGATLGVITQPLAQLLPL